MFHIRKHLYLWVCNLKKPIKVRLLKEAEDYFLAQNEKVQKKFLLAFEKTEAGSKGAWFEKLKDLMVFTNSDKVTIKNSIEYLLFGILKNRKHL